jgi:rhodanese-related sulfurtransferase
MALHSVSVPNPGAQIHVVNPESGSGAPHAPNPMRERARLARSAAGYGGDLTPDEAYELVRGGQARLIDVRTAEERKFVGYVPESVHVAWMTGTALQRNPRFVRELEGKARKDEVLLFFCRSGSRSLAAAKAATTAGFEAAFNVLEGFEGELNERRQRGTGDGWRFRGLPWIQE